MLKGADSIFARMKIKPTLLWFAPLIGLNVEYLMDVLALFGTFVAFSGYVSFGNMYLCILNAT